MKINVNYDLLDAASQANDGLSFKLYQKNNFKNPFTYVNLGLMITQMTLLSEFNEISIPFYGALFITQGVILKYFNIFISLCASEYSSLSLFIFFSNGIAIGFSAFNS